MVWQIFLLVAGFALLMKGADWFVEGAAGIASKFKIPQLVIGLTIVAMGTSAPEAAVSITAAMQGNGDVAIGNILGSNILNILIILGIAAVITNIPVARSTVRTEIPYMLLMTAVLMFMGSSGNVVGRGEGAILWILFIIYLAYLFVGAMKKRNKDGDGQIEERSIVKLLLYTVIGLALVVVGARISVDSATYIAKAVGVSDRVIALTIVALGTSLPELCTSVVAAKKGNADIAIGNIVGSNIFNVLFIIGTTALITPVTYAPEFMVDGIIALAAGVLLLVCVARKKMLVRWHGIVMLAAFAGYFVYLMV